MTTGFTLQQYRNPAFELYGSHGTIQMTTPVMLRVIAVAAKPFSPFLARMAGAGAWMDTGAMHFDIAPTRAEFAEIPLHGLKESLPKYS